MNQPRTKIFDDISQLMTNAMGVAQGARSEAETAMKGWVDRWVAERNLVSRDEFEAVRAMAAKAREENEALLARIAVLEKAVAGTAGAGAAAAAAGAAAFVSEAVDPDALKPGHDADPAQDPESDHFERPDGSVQS